MDTTTHGSIDIGIYRKLRLGIDKKTGNWKIWWTDATGKSYLTRGHSCSTKDRSEAEAYFITFCDKLRAQTVALAEPQILTIDELCRRWLEDKIKLGKRHPNLRYILAPVRAILGRHTAADLAAGRILKEYRAQRDASNGTVRRELGALQAVLRWSVEERLIMPTDLPMFKALLESVPPGAARDKFLDLDQEAWFWTQAMAWGMTGAAPDRVRVKWFVALGLETAARREAIMDLTWDRIDISRVSQGAQGFIDYRVPGRRVTNKRRVRLPISARLLPVLQEAWLQAPKDPTGKAIGRLFGDVRDLTRAYSGFVKAIGMEWVTPHVMRHSWASLAALAGLDLWRIAKVLGDSVTMVEKHYAHLLPEHLKDEINFKDRLRATAARRTMSEE